MCETYLILSTYIFHIYIYVTIISDEEITNVVRKWRDTGGLQEVGKG